MPAHARVGCGDQALRCHAALAALQSMYVTHVLCCVCHSDHLRRQRESVWQRVRCMSCGDHQRSGRRRLRGRHVLRYVPASTTVIFPAVDTHLQPLFLLLLLTAREYTSRPSSSSSSCCCCCCSTTTTTTSTSSSSFSSLHSLWPDLRLLLGHQQLVRWPLDHRWRRLPVDSHYRRHLIFEHWAQ